MKIASPWVWCDVADGNAIEMMIDSGSDVNTLSEKDWVEVLAQHIEGKCQLDNLSWENGKRKITAYASHSPLQIEASFSAN